MFKLIIYARNYIKIQELNKNKDVTVWQSQNK